ncbi:MULTISPECIES: Fe-S-containing hydro-lyase [Nitratidesulfovibrio]|jgi:fumarate hydratase subunit beta|uniref:Fe-S-containing hydro-lyase n=2 Tax=Nitratidesulfovibrio TaxID=2802295 RepID=A0ABY9R1B8_9BACT|nr:MULTISPECIES: Fe-S-containing hydro-lyase [Nitratidesulfovibrio]RXF75963.1 Fe-S-containing hydro-lyase [Desulfovibrio sp. DS-1]HCG05685.1 Fe-S-containing hydro-lyase [Desulfovibrio sp.]MBG3875607.1 Fe-S-containing hydro-lyase [Nitratidesulfovibrio oxamicus]MBZ2170633.1 Fe-S-containing hydro-lyase [Nitratidesulfovibrio sp. SRB-5]WMW64803.1 Fe-S-containing hydro-lyase [Nitratidesulfovibrio liaohensis]
MATHHLTTPLTDEAVAQLRSGDVVFLSGTIYTARDAAHRRLAESLDRGEDLPFDLRGAVIYYVGPSPAPPGRPIGSAGPTTSYRMDSYAPRLHALGLKATIGKGRRNTEVRDALKEHTGVYLGATGGAGALLSQCITAATVIAYDDLGPEAIRELTVKDFPLLVINDCVGGELYV